VTLSSASLVEAASPYPASTAIADMSLDWSTHERGAVGSDNFQLTWSNDNHQYGAWGDGGGFGATGDGGADRVGLGVARIEGSWNSWTGHNVWGGKDHENRAQFDGKSWGMISVNSTLYMWVTAEHPNHYAHVEVARSTNHSATWSKGNWRFEQSEWLTIPTFLNFGKDNAGARDNYVYSYFIRPENTTQGDDNWLSKPGVIYLARVHKNNIFGSKSDCQFLTGFDSGNPTGNPIWGRISGKMPVFEDPEGAGAVVSASYNPGIGRYILATQHTKSLSSVLGIFDAPEPWGPWTTVKYYTPSDRFGETRPGSTLHWEHNVFFLAFPTKWLSADGKSFTMTFTGGGQGKNNDSFNTVRGTFSVSSRSSGGR
jgi:hypothetical protein